MLYQNAIHSQMIQWFSLELNSLEKNVLCTIKDKYVVMKVIQMMYVQKKQIKSFHTRYILYYFLKIESEGM